MWYVIIGIICLLAGAVGAVIVYRRHVARIEDGLAEAIILRDRARVEAEALRNKVRELRHGSL